MGVKNSEHLPAFTRELPFRLIPNGERVFQVRGGVTTLDAMHQLHLLNIYIKELIDDVPGAKKNVLGYLSRITTALSEAITDGTNEMPRPRKQPNYDEIGSAQVTADPAEA